MTIVATKIALKIVLAAFCSTYVVQGNKNEAKRIAKEIYGMDPDGDWMGELGWRWGTEERDWMGLLGWE